MAENLGQTTFIVPVSCAMVMGVENGMVIVQLLDGVEAVSAEATGGRLATPGAAQGRVEATQPQVAVTDLWRRS